MTADWGRVSASEQVQITIVNGLGQSVFSTGVALKAAEWNLEIQLAEGVANGLYILRIVRSGDGSSTAMPVLIQR